MLDHISWLTYAVSLLMLTAAYYVWVAIRFYRKPLLARLGKNIGGGQPAALTPVPATASVIGKVAPEPGEGTTEANLFFGEPDPDDPRVILTREDAVETSAEPDGTTDGFRSEVETLIAVVADAAEPKENFLLLFGLLTEKYAAQANERVRQEIFDLVLDQADRFAFKLKSEELNEQWKHTLTD